MEPANFLDVGGTVDAKRVEEAFRIILRDENKGHIGEYFGGIVRCDRVRMNCGGLQKHGGPNQRSDHSSLARNQC